MDRFNYIAWVDNVCQKFEDVCLEVDNIRPEEIIGAAETQLQTMGASITKFFSELVDDVVPQGPTDHVVEEEVSDLSPVQKSGVMAHKDSEVSMDDGHCEKVPLFPHLKQNNGVTVHEKSRMIIRRNPIKEKDNQLESLDIHEKKDSEALSSPLDNDAESSDILEKKDSVTRLTPASSPPLDNTESLDILEKKDSVTRLTPASSPPLDNTESLDILEKKDSVMAALSSPLEISNESLDILEKKDPVMVALSSALDDDTEINSLIEEGEGSLYSNSSTLMGSRGSEILDIEVALNVALAESTGDSVDDVRMVELETIQPLTKAKLDESCFMVDSSELCAVSGDVRRSGSDKKKLRLKSIFALRKKAGDWECDHSHLDVGCYQQSGKGLAAYDNSELLDDGFSESEWEII